MVAPERSGQPGYLANAARNRKVRSSVGRFHDVRTGDSRGRTGAGRYNDRRRRHDGFREWGPRCARRTQPSGVVWRGRSGSAWPPYAWHRVEGRAADSLRTTRRTGDHPMAAVECHAGRGIRSRFGTCHVRNRASAPHLTGGVDVASKDVRACAAVDPRTTSGYRNESEYAIRASSSRNLALVVGRRRSDRL